MTSAGTLFAEPATRYVEVAVPVPIRRRFTYEVPPGLVERLAVGSRVAVPFSRRKLPAFVLGFREQPPEGVTRIRKVAGLLDPEPLFPPELLAFLLEAARYYLHPVGEVLRAAAPAMPTGAMKRLRTDGFLSTGETLPGARIATRTTTVVRPTGLDPGDGRFGKNQQAVLALLQARGEIGLDELRRHVKTARQTVRTLLGRGLVEIEEREVLADPFFGVEVTPDTPPELNPAQQQATDAVIAAVRTVAVARRAPEVDEAKGVSEPELAFLLHGVTGSGKTEIYLRAIAEARSAGLGALLLVPEIALTPQLVARFRARFGDSIAVLHSGLGDRQRDDAWRALRTGAVSLAIGARSALFAPVKDLGVIVVDEEHDPSFKQEEGFRYHARDMALLRAARAGALCILGSATPSVETRYLAERGRIRLLELPDRATVQSLPSVEIVDLARNRSGPSGNALLSAPLHRALEACLADGGQAILFLNRRGFAPSVRCAACGEVVECPACSVALTEHRRAGLLRCHYCDFSMPPGERCPDCGAGELTRIGLGTEKLEDTLREAFAPARIARLDRDTATGAGVESVLDQLRHREIDILVGTQMVTKGHDMPGVTLVGVVLADQSLAFPDFRAAERTFQLLSQVAGRAGRGEAPGRVVFQTFQPDNPAIRLAAAHDYDAFYRAELSARRELAYTPFSRLVAVRVDAGDEGRAREAAEILAHVAASHPAAAEAAVRVLGPAVAPIARLRGRYRYRVLLQGADRRRLRAVAAAVAARVEEGLGPARATVDVDPVSML